MIFERKFMETISEKPSPEDILKSTEQSLNEFANSFGEENVFREILLEELFKILLERK
jgi:hypothetical protein